MRSSFQVPELQPVELEANEAIIWKQSSPLPSVKPISADLEIPSRNNGVIFIISGSTQSSSSEENRQESLKPTTCRLKQDNRSVHFWSSIIYSGTWSIICIICALALRAWTQMMLLGPQINYMPSKSHVIVLLSGLRLSGLFDYPDFFLWSQWPFLY